MIAVLCALLGGAMFYLSQGIDNVWWLAWFAPAPLLWLAYGQAIAWQVFLAALVASAAGQIYMLLCYGPMLIVTVLSMMFGGGALFAGAILLSRRVWRTLPPAAALFAFPALWTAVEYLEGWISPHGSWGALGYSQVSFPAAIQIAALFGVYAVSFTLCLFANALALAARGARETAAAGVILCALSIVFGAFQLAAPQTGGVRVAALSDFRARETAVHKLDLGGTLAMTREYAAAAEAEAAKGARLIVIPEGAIAADPGWLSKALAPLADVARRRRVTIVIGTVLVTPWRNTAQSLLPDGRILAYDKRHLLLPGEAHFSPGRRPGLLGRGRAVAICKDMDFPRTLRADALAAAAQRGIRVMAVPASDFVLDGWIHARMAIMRGVENGFAIARSAFRGMETISDARGRVIARADTNRPGLTAISAVVEPGGGATLYTRIGDVFAWACLALSVLLGALSVRPGFLPPRA
jgi:apolipoprotein N-acyltransferase